VNVSTDPPRLEVAYAGSHAQAALSDPLRRPTSSLVRRLRAPHLLPRETLTLPQDPLAAQRVFSVTNSETCRS
jgi:hypothetical protein